MEKPVHSDEDRFPTGGAEDLDNAMILVELKAAGA